jgi:hypothetical protein
MFARFLIFTPCLVLLLCTAASAQVNLFIFPESASPDSMILKLNGGIWPDSGVIIDWIYDWDDGTINTGFFPKFHTFPGPGAYLIRTDGYNDRNEHAADSFLYHLSPVPATDVDSVALSEDYRGLICGESFLLNVQAFDAAGNPLSLQGRDIRTFMVSCEDYLDIALQDTVLSISAANHPNLDAAWNAFYVYVDRVRSVKPVHVITNRNQADYWSASGDHVGIFLPDTFLNASNLTSPETAQILDLGFGYQDEAIGPDVPFPDSEPFQGISYAPPVYGGSGNPLLVGDFTLPYNNGIPHFDVIFHEMGHNFSSACHALFGLNGSGPFYQETLAEWFMQYTLREILQHQLGESVAQCLVRLDHHPQR